MRYGPTDKFWLVLDPIAESNVKDNLQELSLLDLYLLFQKGGLTMERNPTIFTDETEAEIDAFGRLVAMRACEAIKEGAGDSSLRDAWRVELLNEDGKVVFEAELEPSEDDE